MNIKNLHDKLKHRLNLIRANRDLDHFHKIHKQAAFSAIRRIEELNGQKLTIHMRNKADEYAVEVFGDKRYAPWLYFYSAFRGEFKEGWIPANFYSRYVLPDKGLHGLAITKTFSKTVHKTNAIPDIAYLISGLLFNKEFSPINLLQLNQIVGNETHVIVKNNTSVRGRGVSKVRIDALDKKTLSSLGDCVFQSVVRQHKFFDDIVTGPLSTIRIATVRNTKGRIEYRGGYLKLGRQGFELYKSDAAIIVPVLNSDGMLDDFCYTFDFKRMTNHPDSNYSFQNKHLPKFHEAVDFCIKCHQSIPHFPIIGWDIAVDRDEKIKMLEWNAGIPHPAIKTLEITIGPCFKDLHWEQLRGKKQ